MVPKVMIILGSSSDIHIAEKSMDILEKLEIPYSLKIASAHRTPNLIREIVKKGTDAGIEVFIGIAGLAAHLPGAIAAYTPRPVIGVPVDVKTGGIDALDSCVHMPYPSPIVRVPLLIIPSPSLAMILICEPESITMSLLFKVPTFKV